jgi:uncharacterized RDD family membrane protein YckC
MGDDQRYVGLATRTVAFVIDAVVLNVVALVVAVGAALILSVFRVGHHHDLKTVLLSVGAAVYGVWVITYFAGFWAATGQTPGGRFMRMRVVAKDGGRVRPWWALLRSVALLLSPVLLFAGCLLVLFDRRRRALHDVIARTVVIESPLLSPAAERRARRRVEQALRSSHSGDERAAPVAQA